MIKLSKRYADALFKAVSEAKADYGTIKDELDAIKNSIFEDDELGNFFLHPIISIAEKEKVLVETFENKIQTLTLNFVLMLLKENRFNLLPQITVEFVKRIDEKNNIKHVELIFARKVQNDLTEKIKNKLQEKLDCEIVIESSIDESILSGFIAKWEDNVIDLSLKKKFETLGKV